MKTADLIEGLAADSAPVARASPVRRLAVMAIVGGAVAFGVLIPWLGMRPMAEATRLPSFWMKAGYTLALAAAAWILAARLSRPGASARGPLLAVAMVTAFMVSMGVMQISMTPTSEIGRVWLGHTWNRCPYRILIAAAPIFVLIVLAIRRLAPTRLRAAGAAGGLLAGAMGATVYGLCCDETTAAFTATWYTLGIGACAAIGALLGPRLLRW